MPDTFAIIGSKSFFGAAFYNLLCSKNNCPAAAIARPQFDLNKDMRAIQAHLAIARPSIVVNFAAQSMVAQSWTAPLDWFRTNVMALVELTDWLRKQTWLRRYIHISTPEVYGSREDEIVESFGYTPSTPYATSRAAGDMWLRNLHDAYGFPVVFVRAANIYGPRQQLYRLIPKLGLAVIEEKKFKLDGGGRSCRSFLYIDDAARGVLVAAERGDAGRVYHLTSNDYLSIREVAERVCNEMHVPPEAVIDYSDERLGKDMHYRMSGSRAAGELEWRPKVELQRGISETMAWLCFNYSSLKQQPREYVHYA